MSSIGRGEERIIFVSERKKERVLLLVEAVEAFDGLQRTPSREDRLAKKCLALKAAVDELVSSFALATPGPETKEEGES